MLEVAVEREARKRSGTRGFKGKIVLRDRKGRMVGRRRNVVGWEQAQDEAKVTSSSLSDLFIFPSRSSTENFHTAW